MSDELTDYEKLREQPSLFISEICGVEPFFYQKEFMDTHHSRKAFVSGRQVGKSRTCAWIGLHRAVTHPNETVLITADAMRQSSELFATLRSEMAEAGITDSMWGVERDTQTVIEFDNGSRIVCLPTGRDGSKIRGYSADLVIVDEAAFMEDAIIEDVIEPMLFATNGDMVLASTPWGTSGYFYEKATSPNWHSTWDPESGGISSDMNPLIDDEDLETYKEGKTTAQLKREVYGVFVDNAETFFPPELIKSCIDDDVKRGEGDVYLGADLAAGGADETVLTMADEHGNVFNIESYDISVMESADRIAALDKHYDFRTIVVDRTGIGEGPVEMLKERLGHRKVKDEYLSTQKKQSIYQTLKAEMESGRISFPRDEKLRTQLEDIKPNRTKNGNLSLHAQSGHDDYPDSLALCVWGLPETAGGANRTGARGSTSAVSLGDLRRNAGRDDPAPRRPNGSRRKDYSRPDSRSSFSINGSGSRNNRNRRR